MKETWRLAGRQVGVRSRASQTVCRWRCLSVPEVRQLTWMAATGRATFCQAQRHSAMHQSCALCAKQSYVVSSYNDSSSFDVFPCRRRWLRPTGTLARELSWDGTVRLCALATLAIVREISCCAALCSSCSHKLTFVEAEETQTWTKMREPELN